MITKAEQIGASVRVSNGASVAMQLNGRLVSFDANNDTVQVSDKLYVFNEAGHVLSITPVKTTRGEN